MWQIDRESEFMRLNDIVSIVETEAWIWGRTSRGPGGRNNERRISIKLWYCYPVSEQSFMELGFFFTIKVYAGLKIGRIYYV